MRKKVIVGISLFLVIILIFYGCVTQSNLVGEAKNILKGKGSFQCNDRMDNDGDGYCDFLRRGLKCNDGSTPGDVDCESKGDEFELSELQLTACNSAEKGNTCETKLERLGLVTQDECCNAIGKCC